MQSTINLLQQLLCRRVLNLSSNLRTPELAIRVRIQLQRLIRVSNRVARLAGSNVVRVLDARRVAQTLSARAGEFEHRFLARHSDVIDQRQVRGELCQTHGAIVRHAGDVELECHEHDGLWLLARIAY